MKFTYQNYHSGNFEPELTEKLTDGGSMANSLSTKDIIYNLLTKGFAQTHGIPSMLRKRVHTVTMAQDLLPVSTFT
ncbi:MAG: hypothetical protein DRN33_05755 [Thermoplasmata archaeon]|nr:MAG: hypothetical protein DRN33_05755 [Thermoplasmata archaeon]